MVDEENAFQMVMLVLDARRHQPGHAFLMMLAVLVLPVDGDLGGARHIGILFGDRQAAFRIDAMLLALVGKDGVDEHARLADHLLALFILGIGFLQVDHQDALRHPDLNRRQPDAGGVVHRLEHIGDQLLQLGIEGLDGLRNDAQPGIRGLYDGEYGHGVQV